MDLEEVKSMVKSCLILRKGGLPVPDLKKEFRELVGINIPFESLGFHSLKDFLLSIPEVYLNGHNADGVPVLCVKDEKLQHIQDLVKNQKSKKKPAKARSQQGQSTFKSYASSNRTNYGNSGNKYHSNGHQKPYQSSQTTSGLSFQPYSLIQNTVRQPFASTQNTNWHAQSSYSSTQNYQQNSFSSSYNKTLNSQSAYSSQQNSALKKENYPCETNTVQTPYNSNNDKIEASSSNNHRASESCSKVCAPNIETTSLEEALYKTHIASTNLHQRDIKVPVSSAKPTRKSIPAQATDFTCDTKESGDGKNFAENYYRHRNSCSAQRESYSFEPALTLHSYIEQHSFYYSEQDKTTNQVHAAEANSNENNFFNLRLPSSHVRTHGTEDNGLYGHDASRKKAPQKPEMHKLKHPSIDETQSHSNDWLRQSNPRLGIDLTVALETQKTPLETSGGSHSMKSANSSNTSSSLIAIRSDISEYTTVLNPQKMYEPMLFDHQLIGDDFFLYMASKMMKCKVTAGMNVLLTILFCCFGLSKVEKIESTPNPEVAPACGLCISGLTISDCLKELISTEKEICKYVILHIGAIDILNGTDMETIKKQMLALIRQLSSSVKDLVVLTLPQLVVMPPLEHEVILKRQLDFNQWLFARNGRDNVRVLDIWDIFSDGFEIQAELYEENAHTAEGLQDEMVLWNETGMQYLLDYVVDYCPRVNCLG